ncbi:hypothetical protein GOP47_0029353 [Adiantum capillus-veneris]|nr:hypothetical protein GOP47_0029353 [Adiantum capillus-veneris]
MCVWFLCRLRVPSAVLIVRDGECLRGLKLAEWWKEGGSTPSLVSGSYLFVCMWHLLIYSPYLVKHGICVRG